ncbi:MAG: hydroxymethylbilane synthase [Candidatus Marinamargulisbacteria bacterium]
MIDFNQQGILRLGSRGSALALVQANRIKDLLVSKFPQINVEIVIIKTSGDINQGEISALGGKSIFVKEIELALLNNEIDIAVHSFKDITSQPVAGLSYSAFLLEERSTDALILFDPSKTMADQLTIATGSLRRQSLCAHLYPTITCVPIRGNIDSRIKQAKEKNYDGVILSTAGLQRLGLDHLISVELNPEQFIPAPGQGMLAIQHRSDDSQSQHMVQAIGNNTDNALGQLYFSFLQGISFNCNLPLGASISDQNIHIFICKNKPKYLTFPISECNAAISAVREEAYV